MTPKEKAMNLYCKFRNNNYSTWINKLDAKKMCLIAVDEILYLDSPATELNEFEKYIEYWQEIKQEIEKL